MARRIKLIQLIYPLGNDAYRIDPLGPFTTDDNAWRVAENAAEKHVAGWLFMLAGRAVPEFELAALVHVDGLDRRRPHSQGCYTWQCEGAALLIASGLDPAGLEIHLSDYRTAQGRIDRRRDASSQRAALICAEMEAGAHPRDAINRHKLPQVKRGPAVETIYSEEAATLDFYRQLVMAGEVQQQ